MSGPELVVLGALGGTVVTGLVALLVTQISKRGEDERHAASLKAEGERHLERLAIELGLGEYKAYFDHTATIRREAREATTAGRLSPPVPYMYPPFVYVYQSSLMLRELLAAGEITKARHAELRDKVAALQKVLEAYLPKA